MNDLMCSTVASTLDEMEIPYKREGFLFKFTVSDDYADLDVRIIADDDNEVLTVVGFFPVKISNANLDKMYKVINDINLKNLVGHYAINSEDGVLSFRLTNNVDGGAINEGIVKACFLQVMFRLRNTYEDIMKAMYGGPQMNFTFASESRPSEAS